MPFHWNYEVGTGKNNEFELFSPKWREPRDRFWPNGPDVTSLLAKLLLEYLEKNICHTSGIM